MTKINVSTPPATLLSGVGMQDSKGILDLLHTKTKITPQKGGEILTAANKVLFAAQETARNIIASGAEVDVDAEVETNNALMQEAPVLRQANKKLTNDGTLLLLMTQLQDMGSEMAMNKLKANLSFLQKTLDSRRKEGERTSAELEGKLTESGEALDEFGEAINNLKNADGEQQILKQELNKALTTLNELSENDPGYESAKINLESAQKALDSAEKKTASAQKIADEMENKSIKLQGECDALLNKMEAKYTNHAGNVILPMSGEAQKDKQLTNMATMTLLLSKFIEIIGEKSLDKLKNDLEMTRKLQSARQKEMMKKSDEYEEQLRKAEETQKIVGCVGKILGGIAIAVGAVTSVFGGAGVGLMAVGIGLMAADPIMEAITGQSLTSMIMNPLMEHIFTPLMALVSKIVDIVFDKTPMGLLLAAIEKATGSHFMDTIKTVVSAAVTIAVVIALAYFAKSAAKFVIEKMGKTMTNMIMETIKKSIQQALKKIMPKAMKNAGKQASKSFSQFSKTISEKIAKDPISMQVNLNRLKMVEMGTNVSRVGTQVGGNITVGTMQAEAMKALAAFQLCDTDMQILQKASEVIIEKFQQEQMLMQVMTKNMSDVLAKKQSTGRMILRQVHA